MKKTYNVVFYNYNREVDETQVDIYNDITKEDGVCEFTSVILSLSKELEIQSICEIYEAVDEEVISLVRFPLSIEEANALEHIVSITKMDCWFTLYEYEDLYCVYDLENEEYMQLDEALGEALDGFVDDEFLKELGASESEIKALENVMIRLGVIEDTNPDKNVWD